jgi:linoleoyl-CoA desaturase
MTRLSNTQDNVAVATVTGAGARKPPHIGFAGSDHFQKTLKARVERYFSMTGRSPRDCWQMYLKTAIIFAWLIASYVLLVFFANAWWQAVPLTLSLGFAMAAVGFNVQHDGNHRAYSRHQWINKVMAMSLDLLGGSSYTWTHKHNTLHHTYANIADHDDDIDLGFLGRLAPEQKRRWFHRLQHYYLWALYGFLPIKWHFVTDFVAVARGKIGTHRFARPKGWSLATFIGGKALFFSLAFVIPALVHPLWLVVLFYFLAFWVNGLIISVVFQLAHIVEQAEFPVPDEATGKIQTHWAVHQVQTTVNFARNNWLLTWFLGGLNFQIEHHLFPKISHIHYPRISRLVENACAEFGLRYNTHSNIFSAVASHFRWLQRMGQPEVIRGS